MSSLPRKKSKRSTTPLHIVLISGGVLLAVFVGLLLFVKSSLNGWLHGDGFREWISRRAATALRSEVSLPELKWTGSEVYASKFEAIGTEEARFSGIVLDGIRAKMGGIRNKAFRVPEVTVNRLNLDFSPERKGKYTYQQAGDPIAGATGEAPRLPDWLSQFAPNRVEIDGIAVASANVTVRKPEVTVFSLLGTKADFAPDFLTGSWEVSAKGGKMLVPNQPEILLKDLGLRWSGSDLFVDRCALGIYKNGHIQGSGEIGFGEGGLFDVDLTISAIEVDELVTGDWKERLSGIIDGPVHITGAPGAFVYEGALNVTEGVIESIPVLKRIAQYTRSDRFNRLVLNETRTDFKSIGETVELRNLVIQSDGLVRIEGQIDLVGEQISGDLKVGVTPGTMRWIPGAERLVFVEDRDGFRWAPLKLTGTTSDPKEDLSARLIGAAGEALIGELPDGLLKGALDLISPQGGGGDATPGELIDTGKKILDLFAPILKRK